MQQEESHFRDILLQCQSKVAELTEEINQLKAEKSRLEWLTVGGKSYQQLKRHLLFSCCLLELGLN